MSNTVRVVVGLLVLLMLAALIAALIYVPIPASNENTLVQLVGTMSTLAGLVVGYYFGSSDGSRRKTEILGNHSDDGGTKNE